MPTDKQAADNEERDGLFEGAAQPLLVEVENAEHKAALFVVGMRCRCRSTSSPLTIAEEQSR